MTDPLDDTFADRVEEKIRDLMLASADLDELAAIFKGDPWLVPAQWHPFALVALLVEQDPAKERGFESETGPVTYWKYEGVVQIETLGRDASGLTPVARKADVPSYKLTRRLVQGAKRAILAWCGPDGGIPDGNRIISADGKESSLLLVVGRIENGLAVQARSENVTNTGSFPFTLFTRREDF